MLNIASDMGEKQGLNANKWYEAVVVSNDDRQHPDGQMLGRVRARVAVLFDGIADNHLPWAIPIWLHPDGASETSGAFDVPKIGTKVFLKFQGANPAFPMYRGFHSDRVTQMEEVKHNYPNRKVLRLQNKALVIVDTGDNTLYLRNPGNTKIYIDGNVEMEVTGNVDELIYGNVRREIRGNLTQHVKGDTHLFTSGKTTLESGGQTVVEGSQIHLNSGMGKGSPAAITFEKWPGVPGGAKGNNTRPALSSKVTTKPDPSLSN